MPKNSKAISCKNVWKLYGSNPSKYLASKNFNPTIKDLKESQYIPAVFNASIDVYEGEILVIMGLSGSGKSSLVRCMTRLIEPTSGEIYFEGSDLLKATDKELIEIRRHKMGMVFQNFALMPHRNVLDNIAFPLEVQGISREKREKRALEIIDLVGLQGRSKYYPRELSGGQQQRAAIARALAISPEILLFDEPTSSLDPELVDEVLSVIRNLAEQGKTMLVVTHEMEFARKVSNNVIFLHDGLVEEEGHPDTVFTNPQSERCRNFLFNRRE